MRRIIFLLLAVFLILFSGSSLKKEIKQLFPREGKVEKLGEIYTPYLLNDSPLYFLKKWDERIELFFTSDYAEKAKKELSFANKRLLEASKMTERKKYRLALSSLDDFAETMRQGIFFAEKVIGDENKMESLSWLFQDALLDQQRILMDIVGAVSGEEKKRAMAIKEGNLKEVVSLIKNLHGLNQDEFQEE